MLTGTNILIKLYATTVVPDQYVQTLFAIRMCKVHSICSAYSLDKAYAQSDLRYSPDF